MALTDAYIVGLNDLLKDLKALPKEAQAELRSASVIIAERHMVPAWKNAAIAYAGPWGPDIADSIRAKRDRLPTVRIGDNKKTFRGGASANVVRYPSDSGERGNSFAPFEKTDWIAKRRSYTSAALREWGEAVDRIVRKWNNG